MIRGRKLNLSAGPLVGAALALSIVSFTLGSSSVAGLKSFGSQARWVMLVLLLALAVLELFRERRRLPRLRGRPAWAATLGAVLIGLAVVSTTWSGDPRLTLHRAGSFAVLVAAAGALSWLCLVEDELALSFVVAIVVATAIVDLGGFVLLAVAPHTAAQVATASSAWRYRGLGENPNTVSMLAGVTLPLGLSLALRPLRTRALVLLVIAVGLAFATIVLSDSRGALAAGVIGSLVFAISRGFDRRAMQLVAGVLAAGIAGAALSQVPKATAPTAASTPTAVAAPTTTVVTTPAKTVTIPARTVTTATGVVTYPSRVVTEPARITTTTGVADFPEGPLTDEVGLPQSRSFFSSSGRVQAWRGAIAQADARPLLGYGFGTEANVFFDRYQTFESAVVENSYIGLYLQLGGFGVVLLVGLFVLSAIGGLREARGGSPVAAGAVGVVAAGLIVMCVQSYVYAPGNLATLPVWISVGLCATLGSTTSRARAGWRPSMRFIGFAIGALLLIGVAIPVARWEKHRAIAKTGRAMERLAAVAGPTWRKHLTGGRIAAGFDCLIYSPQRKPVGDEQFALEFCFSADGYLAEAIDRRGAGSPRFYSLRDEPSASPVHVPVATLLRNLHRVGLFRNAPLSSTLLPTSTTDYGAVLVAR